MRHRRVVLIGLVALLGACGGAGGAAKTSPTTGSSTTASTGAGIAVVTEPPTTGVAGGAGGAATSAPGSSGASPTAAPGTAARTSPTPAATAPPANCTVGPQAPPAGSIGANSATALAFAPDGRLFFTERAGTVRVFQGGQSKVFATVTTVTTEPGGGYSERGLLGLAIDPQFPQNRFVYAFYSDADYSHQRVIRWTDCGGVATAARIIITLPSGSDCCHKGGRLAFGPDGKLYVTLGEEHDAPAAQSTSDVRGKVLRYNPDGSVPTDNPFPGSPVWAFGLRNPFGIAFSGSGQMAITNNGPSGEISGGPATGYDTVIFSAPKGGGYQWPYCYGYSHPNPGMPASCGGRLAPDWSSENTTVVPTGAAFVDQAGPAGYRGKLVVCTYNVGGLAFTPGAPGGAPGAGPSGCKLDIKEGPDHALYFSSGSAIERLG
jgi:glucose/arabinose dehydrogenase